MFRVKGDSHAAKEKLAARKNRHFVQVIADLGEWPTQVNPKKALKNLRDLTKKYGHSPTAGEKYAPRPPGPKLVGGLGVIRISLHKHVCSID